MKSKGVTDLQLLKIINVDDYKGLIIAENLANRFNPTVPPNQLHKIVENSVILKAERPTIMDELIMLSSSEKFNNPNELSSWVNIFKGKIGSTGDFAGDTYELEISLEKLESSIKFAMGKQNVPATNGLVKEVDHIDYDLNLDKLDIMEVKAWVTPAPISNPNTMLYKIEEIGVQLGKIHIDFRAESINITGRGKILHAENPYYNSSRGDIIELIKSAKNNTQNGDQINNATRIIIENNHQGSPHIIFKNEWQ